MSMLKPLLLTGLIGTASVAAADRAEMIEDGRLLFEEGRCMACHQYRPFDRGSTRLKGFPSLMTMVETCNTNLGLGWFPDEVEAVSHYLNQRFYGFEVITTANEAE
ncbi:hypothetical protein [Sulfurivirga sp.]|uniref:hypothetical protein n=1 Tax=Sulfurivirga sp. TaxID=2614236 RepID=UPI0025D17A1B|nr:hypothetical protein [Sulfurivirga sp.]